MKPGETLPPTQVAIPVPAAASEASTLSEAKPLAGAGSTVDYLPPIDSKRDAFALGQVSTPEIPGYEIDCELGRGGMGVVYQARDVQLGRPVALKMILGGPISSEEQRLRFLIEAETLAKLQHPNIVQLFEIGASNGHPYFALEFVAGGTLAARIKKHPLTPAAALVLTETLARAVHAAHLQGIIHRDLKPANVLITPTGIPKISDFGLAKRLSDDAHLTMTGQAMGTPSYMAPEQAAGQIQHIGPATDVYALGAILYELLTGRVVFQASTFADLFDQLRNSPPLPPRRLKAAIPKDAEVICLKCLEKAPAARYPSAADLADDLRRLLENRPIIARPVSRGERAWKWARRNPTIATLAGLLAVALVGGLAGMTSLYFRAERRRGDAQFAEGERKKERDSALKAKQAAEHSEQRTRLINDFLFNEVLSAAQANSIANTGLGQNITLQGALNAAEPRISLVFAEAPELEASIRVAFSTLYMDMGDFEKAQAQLERAGTLTKHLSEMTPEDRIFIYRGFAAWERKRGNSASEALVLEQLRALESDDVLRESPASMLDQAHLVRAWARLGRLEPADALLRHLRAILPNATWFAGPLDFCLLDLEHAEAVILERRDKIPEALAKLQATLVNAVQLGNRDPLYYQWTVDAAILQLALGQTVGARQSLERVLSESETIISPRHPERWNWLLWFAWARLLEGEREEAQRRVAELQTLVSGSTLKLPLFTARLRFLAVAVSPQAESSTIRQAGESLSRASGVGPAENMIIQSTLRRSNAPSPMIPSADFRSKK